MDGDVCRLDHAYSRVLYIAFFDVANRRGKISISRYFDSYKQREGEPASSSKANENSEQDLLLQNVKTYIKTHHLSSKMTAKRDERGVVLVPQEAVLFQTGKADVLKNAEPVLHQIAVLLKTLPNAIQVEGHTDSRRISTYQFPSNWELSSARAASVIRYFTAKEDFSAKRFISVGYADTKPVKDNKSIRHMKENRRVEIVIKKTTSS